MKCEDAGIELMPLARGELDEVSTAVLADHVQGCAECQRETAALTDVVAVVSALGAAPAEELRPAVLGAVATEQIGATLRNYGAGPARAGLRRDVLEAVAAQGTRDQDSVTSLSSRKRRPPLLAAAAIIGVLLVAVSSVLWLGPDTRPQPPVAEGEVPAGHETQVIALSGMGPGDASVRHYRHDNFRVSLSMEGYDVTPPGSHYAVWVRGDGGEVAIGTFRLKGADDFVIPFAVGVNPTEYPQFVVTLEPNDGDPALNGEVVTRARFDPTTVHHGTYDE